MFDCEATTTHFAKPHEIMRAANNQKLFTVSENGSRERISHTGSITIQTTVGPLITQTVTTTDIKDTIGKEIIFTLNHAWITAKYQLISLSKDLNHIATWENKAYSIVPNQKNL